MPLWLITVYNCKYTYLYQLSIMASKLKIKFLSNLKFDEEFVLHRVVEVLPKVNVRDIHVTNFFAVLVLDSPEIVNLFFSTDILLKLQENHLKPVPTQEFLTNKALFITKLKPFITKKPYEVIVQEINKHNHFKVNSVFKLNNKSYDNVTTLKIIFDDPLGADYVFNNGLSLFNIDVHPNNIHKEHFDHVTQCYKCFLYGHSTKECNCSIQKCSVCAGDHHFSSCPTKVAKCINCKGNHNATSIRCPKRRKSAERNRVSVPNTASASNFPPLNPSNNVHNSRSTLPNPHPSQPIPNASRAAGYSSVLKTPPPVPPPPKSLSSLPTRFTKLTPRSISVRSVPTPTPQPPQITQPIVPVPLLSIPTHPPPSSTHPLPLPSGAAQATNIPTLSSQPPPSTSTIPPPHDVHSRFRRPRSPSPPRHSNSFDNLYFPFKVAERLADKLAGNNHFIYAKLMNTFLLEHDLNTIDLNVFFAMAEYPLPSNLDSTANPTPQSQSSTPPPPPTSLADPLPSNSEAVSHPPSSTPSVLPSGSPLPPPITSAQPQSSVSVVPTTTTPTPSLPSPAISSSVSPQSIFSVVPTTSTAPLSLPSESSSSVTSFPVPLAQRKKRKKKSKTQSSPSPNPTPPPPQPTSSSPTPTIPSTTVASPPLLSVPNIPSPSPLSSLPAATTITISDSSPPLSLPVTTSFTLASPVLNIPTPTSPLSPVITSLSSSPIQSYSHPISSSPPILAHLRLSPTSLTPSLNLPSIPLPHTARHYPAASGTPIQGCTGSSPTSSPSINLHLSTQSITPASNPLLPPPLSSPSLSDLRISPPQQQLNSISSQTPSSLPLLSQTPNCLPVIFERTLDSSYDSDISVDVESCDVLSSQDLFITQKDPHPYSLRERPPSRPTSRSASPLNVRSKRN